LAIGVLVIAGGAYAEAQTRSKPARGKKPAVVVDAGVAPASEPAAEVVVAAVAAGREAEAPAPTWANDGGARMSPLNPQANELPAPAASAAAPPVDYDRLLGDIAALRARVAVVSDVLFQSRLAVVVRTDGAHAKIGRLVVGLDDGAVYTAPPSFAAGDGVTVYDHAVAPGKHAVTVDVERKDDRDDAVRSAQRSRFVVDVPRDHRLELEVRLVDESERGEYDLRVRARSTARPVKR
jgi:hypothetical protein